MYKRLVLPTKLMLVSCRPSDALNSHSTQQFSSLSDDTKVYRMIGPVLLKQDNSEAKSTVDSRLKYIEGEMSVHPMPLAVSTS